MIPTLGIVGGIAPGSTIDYYRLLIDRYRERRSDGSYPTLIINSIDLQRFLALVGAGDRPALTDYLVEQVTTLARAGAHLGLFASNTPHLVFDEVRRQSPIPLVSIVEATADAAMSQGLRRVGLLGTRFTMEGGFYSAVFERHGMSVVTPNADARTFVHDRYMQEFVQGVFRDDTRRAVIDIIDELAERERIEAMVLGGTELPLLFRDGATPSVRLLDTTRIHVDSTLTVMLT
jgi:aspartate racemase